MKSFQFSGLLHLSRSIAASFEKSNKPHFLNIHKNISQLA